MKRRFLLVAAPFVLICAACDDCGPTLSRVAPKIEIVDAYDATAVVCRDQNIRECQHDFGEVPIGQARFYKMLVENPSPVPLVLKSIAFSDDSDTAFSVVGEIPTEVAAAADNGEEITVQFTPAVESAVEGDLVIDSDAANIEEPVVVRFTGSGKDLGGPKLVITPEACDFGDVGVGVTAFCDLALENVGQRELMITNVGFSSDTDTDVFGPAGVFPIPTTIQAGVGASMRLFARPDAAGEMTGTLLVGSTDPDLPEAQVPLRVFGAAAPTAVAEVATVNGAPPTDDTQVRPLDDVILTGVNSQPALATGSIVAYTWELIQQPPESSVQLTQPNAMETGFYFSSSVGTYQGLDVAGTFVVRLTVRDDQGLTSTNDARVTLSSVPSDRLHIQLTWDVAQNDMDLHLIRNSGPYCSDESCYWRNCTPDDNPAPEWDGVGGRTAGDPSLDIDDLSGYGPENINIDAPLNASYTTSVHFYSGSTPTNVTVKIYINGALALDRTRQMTAYDQFWEVAQVQWNNGGAIVADIDGFQTGWDCPFNP